MAAVAAVLGLVAVILGSGCAAVPATATVSGGPVLRIYPGASSATQGFLMVDKNESSGASFSVGGMDPVKALQEYSAGKGSSVEIKSQPLEKNYYINRSTPLYGLIYWKSTPSFVDETAGENGAETEWMKVRVELFTGTKRVGGGEFPYQPVYWDRYAEWTPLGLNFRAETTVLAKGDVLSMKITRFGGLTDLFISTADPVRSFLEVRYFEKDVYQGPILIDEKGRVELPPLEEVEEDDEFAEPALAAVAVFPVLVVGLFRLPRTARLMAFALVMVLVAGGFAGCMASKKTVGTTDATTSVGATFETSVIKNETLREQGVGGIKGRVRDYDNGNPANEVRVSLIGAPNYAVTNKRGFYDLGTAPAGAYVLRFDHPKYAYHEADISIVVGQVLVYNIKLRALSGGDTNQSHVHNEYQDRDSIDVATFPVSTVGSNVNTDVCAVALYACETTFWLPLNTYIPPGTSVAEVTLDWDEKQSNAVQEVALHIKTAALTEADLVTRGPRDPFRLALSPNEPDPGHSRKSTWEFTVSVHLTSNLYAWFADQWLATMPDMTVKVKTYRGSIPFEPAHGDRWGQLLEKKIFKEATKSFSYGDIDFPDDSASYYYAPAAGVFIPPGTANLKGELTWVQQYTTQGETVPLNLEAVDWTILYKPANVPPERWREGLKEVKIDSRQNGKVTFTITPTGDEVDAFYQKASQWRFYIGDDLDRANVEGSYTSFALTLTAYKGT